MALGTIHTVAVDLFVIEGQEPVTAAAVLRRRRQVVLLDAGAGAEQRRSICAIVASYGRIEELILLSSRSAPVPGSNDDLIQQLPARRRRHVRPRDHRNAAAVCIEPYEVLGGSGWVLVGSRRWPGWATDVAGLHVLQLDVAGRASNTPSIAFYISDAGVLLIPDLCTGAREPDPVSVLAQHVQVISTGSGPPRKAGASRFQPCPQFPPSTAVSRRR